MEDSNNGKKAIEEDVEERRYHLPDEIISQHILPCLPIKPLIRCKLLSKQWNLNIDSILHHILSTNISLFIQSGNNFYLYSCANDDYDDENVQVADDNNLIKLSANLEGDVKLGGCSNGLVCLCDNHGRYFYLYNPFTNQSYKYYPDDDLDFLNYSWIKPCSFGYISSVYTCWGFGYVSSVDDYKVVRIIPRFNGETMMVHLYSLKSNTWSKLISGLVPDPDDINSPACLVKETLYWSTSSGRVLAFDLARDTFEFFPHLGNIRRFGFGLSFGDALCVMGEHLSTCTTSSQYGGNNGLIFKIFKYPGRVDSVVYSSDFKTPIFYRKQFLGYTKSGKVFFTNCSNNNRRTLGLLDQCSKRTLATFDNQLLLIAGYVPTRRSPHPAPELPNEPAEMTWPIYQP